MDFKDVQKIYSNRIKNIINMPYIWDAIASFSGYLYQADVALFFVLKKIEEIWDNTVKLENFSFAIEWEEDFWIFFENWDNMEKELFQVKEYDSWLSSKYMDAIMKLALNSKNQDWKPNMHLLIKVEISDNKNPLDKDKLIEKLKKSKDENIIELKKKYCWLELTKEKTNEKDHKDKVNTEFLNYIQNNEIWDKFTGNFKYEAMGDFENIKAKNLGLIEKIKNNLKNENWNTNSLLNYLENDLKNFIQKNKWIHPSSRKNIQFTEIIEILEKEEINFEANWKEILVIFFIKKFVTTFQKLNKPPYIKHWHIKKIKGELKLNFENFLHYILGIISQKIFCDTSKTIDFMKIIVADPEFNNLEDIKDVLSYSDKISNIWKRLDNFLKIFLSYFYFLENNWWILDDFIIQEFKIIEWENIWKIVGLDYEYNDLFYFLQTEVFYQFEFTHLGIHNSKDGKTIKDILRPSRNLEDFNSDITERHKNHNFDITKSFDVKFFNWGKCFDNPPLTFM